MRIDIVSDTVCPWCYVGKRRLERALAASDIGEPEIVWHPFQLNPEMPAGGMERAAYMAAKFGGTARARRAYRMVEEAVASENLSIDFDSIPRTPNTLDSHRLLHYAAGRGVQTAVAEALFQAYFEAGADIGDTATLAAVAGACGLDSQAARDWLDSGADAEFVRDRDRRARAMGIQGVPCFIVDRRYAVSGAQDPEVFRQVFSAAACGRPGGAPAAL